MKLTAQTKFSGCGAKLGPGVLEQALCGLSQPAYPELIADFQGSEDAGLFRIGPDSALVQTVDFFPPIVDDPRLFGRIAAGQPVAAFPPFRRWGMPRFTIYVLLVALVAMYWGKTREWELVYNTGVNLQVLTTMLLFIQGLALVYFLADKYNLSRLTRGIILVLVFTNGWFAQIVIFAGVFDLVADYRRLRTPRSME